MEERLLLWMLRARVLFQPEAREVGQVAQVPDLGERADLVLPHVQLPQPPAAREVAQGSDFVYTGIQKTHGYKLKCGTR